MIQDTYIDVDLEVAEDVETSKTYNISGNKIQGYTDDLEALKQAIYKVLHTKKYEYQIYGFDYGIELESLIGQDPAYIKVELKRRITECLLEDERIQSVENFQSVVIGDELSCTFDVVSIYGELSFEKEVNI